MVVSEALVALLGPARCVGCGSVGALLCGGCAARAGRAAPGLPVRGVDRVLAPWAYEGPARALVLALKLDGSRSAAAPLAAAMAAEALTGGVLGGIVAWVPGRAPDRRRRGFDHAEVLARRVARALGLGARPLLGLVREPSDQASLSARARRRNLVGAFTATPCRDPVLLVDDVVTTGATAAACASALRSAGCPLVEVLAACRAAPR
jgi:predicted amidophosphoribosyltransferase